MAAFGGDVSRSQGEIDRCCPCRPCRAQGSDDVMALLPLPPAVTTTAWPHAPASSGPFQLLPILIPLLYTTYSPSHLRACPYLHASCCCCRPPLTIAQSPLTPTLPLPYPLVATAAPPSHTLIDRFNSSDSLGWMRCPCPCPKLPIVAPPSCCWCWCCYGYCCARESSIAIKKANRSRTPYGTQS
ncbi:hypothetical protein COCSADRAFT_254297 [Bipolaris sorokiniana ND90Pr]|uniref:Uncharacterized protein n=1 Tax=Cochliobolus sativus (strain ND90Pr / ATCC 201652) TaxID=665912 RepID=M2SBC5_COCSN|nr:uncharacterized protein COCSADRAFT_254297 [Bipolaris sorokiniana ND90Pr]EMD59800.1 hypothetical protein COCSADRAFT_254297 [Bipolaris sorokiniana ND90Pr]